MKSERANNALQRPLGKTFADWGLPKADFITAIRAIALGTDIAGLAMAFLQAAVISESAVVDLVEVLITKITTVLFCTGTQL